MDAILRSWMVICGQRAPQDPLLWVCLALAQRLKASWPREWFAGVWEHIAIMVLCGVLLMTASVVVDCPDNYVHSLGLVKLFIIILWYLLFVLHKHQNNVTRTAIESAPIPDQIEVSQVIEDFTSTPENITASDVSTSASILTQLTLGATMNATVGETDIRTNVVWKRYNTFAVERQLSANYW